MKVPPGFVYRSNAHGDVFEARGPEGAVAWGFSARNARPAEYKRAVMRSQRVLRWVAPVQTHSSRVTEIGRDRVREKAFLARGCDALWTRCPGTLLSVKTADCLPVGIFGAGAVAMVHAGWRGTHKQIAFETVRRMSRSMRTNPGRFRAVLGPAICRKCYEVGPEFARIFDRRFLPRIAGKPHLDLAAANRAQLEAAGISRSRITMLMICPKCRNDRFFSYRAEGRGAGRIISWIVMTGDGGFC
ncbi:MAG: polyphenol oxidase family protein [Candidatus Omnitrophica bacterium]|nr:polyphenol oxidase family protein [Candidatus Omnitrophota bacterium]